MAQGRLFQEPQLLVASKNRGKVKEIEALLRAHNTGFSVVSVLDLIENIEEPEETGETFLENAVLKARYYGEKSGLPALADDSGLAVAALKGAPGIYSARWAGNDKDFRIAMQRVEQECYATGSDNRDAAFICALALYWPDGHVEQVEGRVEGTLTFPPRGEKGFGYDPIFIPQGYTETFGEIANEEKQRISHRTDAFSQLKALCFTPATALYA